MSHFARQVLSSGAWSQLFFAVHFCVYAVFIYIYIYLYLVYSLVADDVPRHLGLLMFVADDLPRYLL